MSNPGPSSASTVNNYPITTDNLTTDSYVQSQLSLACSTIGIPVITTNNNYELNATINYIDPTVLASAITAPARSGFPNIIGQNNAKPTGAGAAGWSTDTGYIAGAAEEAGITGGSYDCIVNAIAGGVGNGHHCLIYWNSNGHGYIAGGSYHRLSAGYGFIGAGTGHYLHGDYGVICGGNANELASPRGFIGGGDTISVLATGSGSTVVAGNVVSIASASSSYNFVGTGGTIALGAFGYQYCGTGNSITLGAVGATSLNGDTITISANSDYTTNINGKNNTAAAVKNVLMQGQDLLPSVDGSFVRGSGKFAAQGDSQALDWSCQGTTTDATAAVNLLIPNSQTSQATFADQSTISGVCYIEYRCTTAGADYGKSGMFEIPFGAKVVNGTISLLYGGSGSAGNVSRVNEMSVAVDPYLAVVDATLHYLQVKVEGIAARNIRWRARFVAQQIVG